MIYYHNPKCSKSRQGLEFLKEAEADFKIKEYLKEPLTKSELKALFKKLNLPPDQVIRKKESIYKELGLDKKILNLNDWVEVLIANPKLLERPILVVGDKAAIGRPTENFEELV